MTSIVVEEWLRDLQCRYAVPTVKLRLAAINKLFALLQEHGVRSDNPASTVQGPRQPTKSRTETLRDGDINRLLNSIPSGSVSGSRDRALIATLYHTGAPISAVLNLKLDDMRLSNRGLKLILHQGSATPLRFKAPAMLRKLILEYLKDGVLTPEQNGFLFRTIVRGTTELGSQRIPQSNAYAMIKRRAKDAGLSPSISPHTFRATAIASQLKEEKPRAVAQNVGLRIRSVKKYIKNTL